MSMMKRLLIISMILMSGCESVSRVTEGPADNFIKIVKIPNVTILMAGQSNMERMEWYAKDAISQAYVDLYGAANVSFIGCSVGGTWSGQWLPGNGLLEDCLVKSAGKNVTHLIYWQGESDAYNSIPYWGVNFSKTIAGFRKGLGDIPVVFAQIAYTTDPDWNRGWESIKQQQAAVCISGVKMIKTDDVAVLSDTVHIDDASAKKIGRRFVLNMRSA